MTRAQRLDDIMDVIAADSGGSASAKFLGADGTGVRVYRGGGQYTLWHIEDSGRSHTPQPLADSVAADEAARVIGGSSRVEVSPGRWTSLAERRDVAAIAWALA